MSKKTVSAHSRRYCILKKAVSRTFRKYTESKIWAPTRTKLPVSAGLPSPDRADPVPLRTVVFRRWA